MADVAEVVDGHAADVHAHMTGFDRLEVLQAARERVVDFQGHVGKAGTGSARQNGVENLTRQLVRPTCVTQATRGAAGGLDQP
ncbi:hypothetical protein D9M69_711730 [compost metagenome]